MSIASQLTALEGNISNAYDMVAQRGGTVPARKNMENLDDAIATIPGGVSPYDTKREKVTYSSDGILAVPTLNNYAVSSDITKIGPYALAYAYCGADYGSGLGRRGGVKNIDLNNVEEVMDYGMYGFSSRTFNASCVESISANNLTTVGLYAFYSAFPYYSGSSITFPELTTAGSYSFNSAFQNLREPNGNGCSVSFPELTTCDMYAFGRAFYCAFSGGGVTTVSFPKLTSAGQGAFYNTFYGCNKLTSLDFRSLTTVGDNAFEEAFPNSASIPMTTVDFPELTTAGSNSFLKAFRTGSITTVTFPKLSTIGQYCFSKAFQANALTNTSFPELVNAPAYAFADAFSSSSNNGPLQSISFAKLTTVDNYCFNSAFKGQATITSVGGTGSDVAFPLLATGGNSSFQNMFESCTSLVTATFPSLTQTTGTGRAFGYMFKGCTSLTTVSFPALDTLTQGTAFYYAFQNCTSLSSVSFPALTANSFGSYTNQFSQMLNGCTGVTVHFPAAIQSTIGSWSDVTHGFGGTNTTVLFDL